MVDTQKGICLDELGLGSRSPDGNQGLMGKYRRSLRHRPDIASEAEGTQVVQEVLLKQAFAPQIGDVLLVKVEVPDIIHQLLQAGGNGIAAAVGHPAEENIEIGDTILQPLAEVAVGHGHLVEVEQHRQIQLLFALHLSYPLFRHNGRNRPEACP